jgi:DNA-binding LacI/PurR family transcriptional regulator
LAVDISHEGFQQPKWLGVVDAAREVGVHLVTICSGDMVPQGSAEFANDLFDRVSPGQFDGVILSDELGVMAGNEAFLAWLKAFGSRSGGGEGALPYGLPMLSIHSEIPGIPCVFPSSEQESMKLVVRHLAIDHGLKRIGYIRYPESHILAKYRYEGFVQGMKECGLPIDPSLVSELPDNWNDGPSNIRGNWMAMLDASIDKLEAIISCDDGHAVAVMEELRRRGKRVPGDIAVAGFSDYPSSANVSPSLSSLRLPYYEMGRKALITLVEGMRGGDPPDRVVVPTIMMARESCGCQLASVKEIAAGRRPEDASGLAKSACQELDASFSASLGGAGRSGAAFLSSIREILNGHPSDAVHAYISELGRREYARRFSGRRRLARASELLQQARVLAGEAGRRSVAKALEAEKTLDEDLRKIGQDLSVCFDLGRTGDALVKGLENGLGVESCSVALYDDPLRPEGDAKLMLRYAGGRRLDLSSRPEKVGPSALPIDGLLSPNEPGDLVVRDISFQGERIGIAVFKPGPRIGRVYGIVRDQLASSIKGTATVSAISRTSRILSEGVAGLTVSEKTISTHAGLIAELMDRQSKAVGEEASRIEAIAKTIQGLAAMSSGAHDISERLERASASGVKAVNDSVAAIRAVGERSKEIGALLKSIKDISDSTAILALNAAIQAARAGDAGRSFAVVSQEIRALAIVSDDNVKNIEAVLGGIIGMISQASGLAETAGAQLSEMVGLSRQNAGISERIDAASRDQNESAGELSAATREIVSITGEVRESMLRQKEAIDGMNRSLESIGGLASR